MKRILVTGATGFIGKKLTKALSGQVIILSQIKQLGYDTLLCDLEKGSIPNNALDDIDTVFHLAGIAHDMRDVSKVNDIYQKVNVDATVAIAELAVKSNVKNFVFISSVKAGEVAECIELSSMDLDQNQFFLEGKILLIPQADPGFDWIFSYNVAGLITMYGGGNSHMAIRANEFGLPAAIGVGENIYSTLTQASVVELDVTNRRITVIQ